MVRYLLHAGDNVKLRPGDLAAHHEQPDGHLAGETAMTDISELHAQALDATGRIVGSVAADRWHAATPCAGWDARALVSHLVAGNLWAAELAAGGTIGGVGSRLDGDLLGDDPAAAYGESAAAAAAVFRRPGALDAPCAVSYGPVPGSVYAGHRFLDVLVHGWDLAVATGQDYVLDPHLMEACLADHRAAARSVPQRRRPRPRGGGPRRRKRANAVPRVARQDRLQPALAFGAPPNATATGQN